jgi:hypothetical protein
MEALTNFSMSFIRFAVRMALQCIVANPFPSNLPSTFTKEIKQSLTKSFLMSLIVINAVFFFLDMVTGVPHTDNASGLFHGSLTLQIIGEEPPFSRWSYVYYNIAIASIQFIVLYLSCLLNTDEDIKEHSSVLPGSTYSLNQVEGDGFTGQSMVCCIHPYDIYQMIMSFTTTSQSQDSATSYNDYMGDRLDITRML